MPLCYQIGTAFYTPSAYFTILSGVVCSSENELLLLLPYTKQIKTVKPLLFQRLALRCGT